MLEQVNTSAEEGKGGVEPNEVSTLARHITMNCHCLHLLGIFKHYFCKIKIYINICILGLMTIGSQSESSNSEQNRDFELLRELRDKLREELNVPLEMSMGMSSDYQLG